MKRTISVAAVAALLCGCASAPPPAAVYEAATDVNSPGYLTAPSENGRFVVSYTGTKGMSREQVAQYALLRAAEFTAESGKEWFAVVNTKTQLVTPVPRNEDLKNRSGGGFIGGAGGSGTGTAGTGAPATRGSADPQTGGSGTAGGFGGGAPPTQVLERWTPPKVPQTVIVIQMGSGEQATFTGLEKAPEIFAAKTTADEIRAKMKP